MAYVADLHIHSYLSRACSPQLRPETLDRWCRLKGIQVLATGDFTHPKWLAELKEKLVPAEPGLYRLKPGVKRLSPKETIKRKGLCPVCGKPVTVGVLHRVEKLADRPEGRQPERAQAYENIVPLKEILGQTLQCGPDGKKVDALYHKLLSRFGPELGILRQVPPETLEAEGLPLLALALARMRRGEVEVRSGYDGEYGVISLLKPADFTAKGQMSLF